MENTYLGILRGKIMPMEISAHMLLKGEQDKIFLLVAKQIEGYTTKVTLRNALNTAREQDADNEQLIVLLQELKEIKIDDAGQRAAADVESGTALLDWIEY